MLNKILVAEDDVDINNLVCTYLRNSGFEAIACFDGQQALEVFNKTQFSLIISDIMMPKMDGYTTLKKIRENYDIPVIMLSARSDEYDKLLSFDLGVDDYLTKPFSPKELIARIKAIKNRVEKDVSDRYVYKNLSVDYLGHKVTINNKELKLTPNEYELLCYFIDLSFNCFSDFIIHKYHFTIL